MKVPTREEIIQALKVPAVDDKTDSMGRVIRKNNYSQNKAIRKAFKKGGKYE
jgi:hypothetical protein